MRRPALKAIFSIFTLNRGGRKRPDWERIVIIFSTAVTLALLALFIWDKMT